MDIEVFSNKRVDITIGDVLYVIMENADGSLNLIKTAEDKLTITITGDHNSVKIK